MGLHMELSDLLQHLLQGNQSANMLDRTKCSTTARAIYNYLMGTPGILHGQTDTAIHGLKSEMRAAVADAHGRVYYIQFNHITGGTSNSFIVIQKQDQVVLLQSAVSEFSVHDWLYPALAESEIRGMVPTPHDSCERLRILSLIRRCAFSRGRVLHLQEFQQEFVPVLLGTCVLDTDSKRRGLCYSSGSLQHSPP